MYRFIASAWSFPPLVVAGASGELMGLWLIRLGRRCLSQQFVLPGFQGWTGRSSSWERKCKRGLSGRRFPAAERNSGPPVSAGPYRTCALLLTLWVERKSRTTAAVCWPICSAQRRNARHSTAGRPGVRRHMFLLPCCTGWDGPGDAGERQSGYRQRRSPRWSGKAYIHPLLDVLIRDE